MRSAHAAVLPVLLASGCYLWHGVDAVAGDAALPDASFTDTIARDAARRDRVVPDVPSDCTEPPSHEATSCLATPAPCRSGDSGCTPCTDGVECARIDARTHSVAIAVDGEDMAAVWSQETSGDTRVVYFARVSETLGLDAVASCFSHREPRAVALARATGGWALAVEETGAVSVHLLDENGNERRRPERFEGASTPQLAARPAGGPLLVFARGGALHAALVDDGCTPASDPVALIDGLVEPQFTSAVFIDDAFLVASRSSGITIARVELDGTAESPTTMPTGADTEYPSLAYRDGEILATWSEFGVLPPRVVLTRLDRDGGAIDVPVSLGAIPLAFNSAPIAHAGTASRVMVSGHTGCVGTGSDLGIAHVEGASMTRDVRRVTGTSSAPSLGFSGWRLVGRSADLFGAWIEGSACSGRDGPGALVLSRIPRDF
jgi:hypothetical protein